MQRNDNGEGTSTGSEEGAPSEGAALPENPQWLCEHYQRLCRVKFPCCGKFFPCHRCHNNSEECQNDKCKAKEAFYIECSVCRHQQAVRKSSVIILVVIFETFLCASATVVSFMKSIRMVEPVFQVLHTTDSCCVCGNMFYVKGKNFENCKPRFRLYLFSNVTALGTELKLLKQVSTKLNLFKKRSLWIKSRIPYYMTWSSISFVRFVAY